MSEKTKWKAYRDTDGKVQIEAERGQMGVVIQVPRIIEADTLKQRLQMMQDMLDAGAATYLAVKEP